MIYDDGKVRIEVRGSELGVATIWDAELIWYIAGLMYEMIGRGEVPTKSFTITAADFMRVAERNRSARSYARIEGMLARLQGGQNKTTIEAGGKGYTGFFSWFTEAHVVWRRNSRGEKVMYAVQVELCDWLFYSILKDRRLLAIHNDYFGLSPIQRRLYEIARCHCTTPQEFRIGIEDLKMRVGVEMKLDKFKHLLKGVADGKTPLPEYDVQLVQDTTGALAEAGRRDSLKHLIVVFVARPAALPGPIKRDAIAEDELVEGAAVG
jgi:plasmid replication initiation protein